MQIHKLLSACGGRFKVTAVKRNTTKVPVGRSSTSGVWGYRSGLFSPFDGDSIYRKPTRTAHYTSVGRTSRLKLGHYDRRSAVRSRLLGQVESTTTSQPSLNFSKPVPFVQATR
ncbi:hypothetical protein Zmor_014487 [Zophobas morio]|uniref:Uncharacterized protein n=1 Tax=Zophobas morio TaxID=2755281 RepID=A0AA38IHN4_9CUCU|nr:hypothetical protein Zmor_014487 [Zophobas morio]